MKYDMFFHILIYWTLFYGVKHSFLCDAVIEVLGMQLCPKH